MRKLALAAMAVAMIGATPAAVAGTDEKTYWLGKGNERHSRVDFIVKNGKVQSLFTITGATRCSGGNKVSLANSWDPIPLDGTSFRGRRQDNNSAAFVAGHVRGERAEGRMSAKARWFDESCDTDLLRWKAKQVTEEEWDEAHEPPH
ncbi:MAG: hypothetical protein QOI31_2946 [Solirubrobacterales bacterium]|jgi:hypothetical protein|nr:hypothetical protein [Solirubrobacterales bacterium]